MERLLKKNTYIYELYKHRKLILFLSKEQVKKQYTETTFGLAWAIIQPLTYILTLWFFFTVGLRSGGPIDGHPFMLFLFSGTIVWQLISACLSSGSKAITSNAVLVKNIKFPVMALPLVDILAKMYVHIIMVFIVMGIFVLYGYMPSIYYLNFIYYWFALIIFLTALSFLLSSIAIIFKDLPKLISSIMTPLFWLTPILWYQAGLIDTLEKIFNPFYYFINGYRETFLYQKWFWEDPLYDIYFWIITLLMLAVGIYLFKRIRPVMSDII